MISVGTHSLDDPRSQLHFLQWHNGNRTSFTNAFFVEAAKTMLTLLFCIEYRGLTGLL